MREIKFRMWDIKGETMLLNHEINYDFLQEGDFTNFIPMQFSGLKDKNGNDVYEGDVLQSKPYLFTGKYIISQVIFKTEQSRWVAEEIDPKYSDQEILHEALRPAHETKIVGNIYETPELINP